MDSDGRRRTAVVSTYLFAVVIISAVDRGTVFAQSPSVTDAILRGMKARSDQAAVEGSSGQRTPSGNDVSTQSPSFLLRSTTPPIESRTDRGDFLNLRQVFGLSSVAIPPQKPAAAPAGAERNGGTMALSFQQAVQLALENNFNSLLAHERVNEARGRATEAKAGLFPELEGAIAQRSETVNLAAMGFQRGLFPGDLPTLIGPFNNFDARARWRR
jgi:hypothetical protein